MSSGEAFKLSILMEYKDNASKGMLSTLSVLKSLQSEAKATISIWKNLQNTINKNFSPKTKNQNKPSDFDVTRAQKELDKLTSQVDKRKSLTQRLADINDKVIQPSRQIADTWRREYDSLKTYTDEASKLYLAQAKFKLINLSPLENTKAFEAVTKSVRDMGLTTRAEGIETLTDLHTAFGNLEHAIETLGIASKYRFSFETLFGDKFSSSQIEEQIQNAAKFLEVTGKIAKGREEMERSFNVLTKITNATGGRVTPSEMLLMGRRAGASGRNLTPQGLMNLSAVIQEMGGDKTGTSLMSMYQALVGGVMKQSAAAEFNRLGLIDPAKIEYGKAQKVKKLLPGANKLGNLMMTDPLSAADMLREAMKKGGIKTDDPKEISKELAVLFGNRNAQNLMDILINQRGQVVKEASLANNAKDIEGLYEVASEGNLGKLKKAEKAWADFKAEVGAPLIEILGGLSKGFLPIMKFFGDHPTITQWTIAAMLGLKAFKGIAETASILKTSGLTSFFSNSTNSARNATNALGDFSTKADGLKSKKIGVGIQIASVVGIDLLIRLIEWEIGKALEAGESKERTKKEAKESYGVFTRAETELNKQGLGFSRKDFEGKASTLWAVMLGSGLETALNTKEHQNKSFIHRFSEASTESYLYPISKLAGANNPFTSKLFTVFGGYQTDKFSLGKGFREYAPDLKDPRIMYSFLSQLRDRVQDPNKQREVKEGLQQGFPDSFKLAMEELNKIPKGLSDMLNQQNSLVQNLTGLKDPITQTGTSFTDLLAPLSQTKDNVSSFSDKTKDTLQPLTSLATSANSASTNLGTFSANLANWRPPTTQAATTFVPSIDNPTGSVTNNQNGVFSIPSRAIGGIVEKDGIAQVHAGNVITPAKVTRGVSNLGDLFNSGSKSQIDSRINFGNVSVSKNEKSQGNSNQPIVVHAPITIAVTKNGEDKNFEKKLERSLYKCAKTLEKIIADRMNNGRIRS